VRRTRIAYGPRRAQVGDLWSPADENGPVPLVVLVHGGFWRAPYTKSLMNRLARAVVRRGWAAWNIEYRRIGPFGGGGGWPGTFEDVALALDHVATFAGVDTDRVVTCGHSAGGTLALWAAARHRLGPTAPGGPVRVGARAAISLAGVVDLCEADAVGLGGGAVARLLGGPAAKKPNEMAAASPAALLPLGVPQVLIHGLADTVVPPSMSEAYVARARAAGDDAVYVALDGVDHRQVIDPGTVAWEHVSRHLETTFAV